MLRMSAYVTGMSLAATPASRPAGLEMFLPYMINGEVNGTPYDLHPCGSPATVTLSAFRCSFPLSNTGLVAKWPTPAADCVCTYVRAPSCMQEHALCVHTLVGYSWPL
jgi:hypothetical protein